MIAAGDVAFINAFLPLSEKTHAAGIMIYKVRRVGRSGTGADQTH